MFTRTLGQLGEVGSKAVSCGKLFRLFWGKIGQYTALFVLRMAARLINFAAAGKTVTHLQNVLKALEEMENEVIQVNLVKKD